MDILAHFIENKDFYEVATQVGTLIIAALAFYVSAAQTYTTHLHNKRMVIPHLGSYWESDNDEKTYIYTITNNGLGPAKIKRVTYTLDNTSIDAPKHHQIEPLLELLLSPNARTQQLVTIGQNEYIPQGETKIILKLEFQDENVDLDKIVKDIQERASIRVEYESIVGQKFIFDSKKD